MTRSIANLMKFLRAAECLDEHGDRESIAFEGADDMGQTMFSTVVTQERAQAIVGRLIDVLAGELIASNTVVTRKD